MQKNKIIGFFAVIVLVFNFVFIPLRHELHDFVAINFVTAESEEYPGEIEQDTVWAEEHAVIDYDVVIFDGATLTLRPGSHDFKGKVDMYPGSNLILEEGEYYFRGGFTAYGGNIVFKKGNYVIEDDLDLDGGSKLTIESGSHVKFKKSGGYTPGLYSNESTFIVNGTAAEMVVFESADEYSSEYHINLEGNNNDISEIKYASFIGGGTMWETGGEAYWRNLLIKTAYAADQFDGISTLKIINSNVSIENSKFEKNNYYAIEADIFVSAHVWNPETIRVSNSDFTENTNKLAVKSNVACEQGSLHCSGRVVLTNNYYDSPDGPKYEYNPSGTGNEITGLVLLEGYNTQSNFTQIVPGGPSNVMFLPGLEASRLYDDEEKLWEPGNNGDVEELYLNSNGDSINEDVHANEGEIVDSFMGGVDIYKSFILRLGEMKTNGEINNWNAYAYDWRMPLDKILEDNSLENKLKELAAGSKSRKVTIVAHSNGGLLTKALLQKIGDEETRSLVDKIILVAVPQVGTPSAISAMLHGHKQNIPLLMTAKSARGLAENMSSAYNLLPSEAYFSKVQTPVITFDVNNSADWKDRYDEEINTKSELDDFLSDNFRRVSAISSNLNVPALLNGDLLSGANNQHDDLDNWNAPDGVRVIQIAGWGVPKTISKIEYESVDGELCNDSMCEVGVDLLHPENFDSTIDGDGTVVTPSALWMSGKERYWVDMKKYNTNNKFETAFGILGIDHKNILEIPELNNFIADNISNNVKPVSAYSYLSTEVPLSGDKKRLQYTLHSPLTLDLYDQGRHTGITEEGYVEEEIPGTYYSEIGETKNIFTDENFAGKIEMKGYAEGKFTFSVKEYQGDSETGKITFKDMPTTEHTEVFFNVPDGLESASDLEIDKDGDGDIDYVLEPKINEVVTLDTTAPTTESFVSGKNGENGWYVDDVTFSLDAKDENGGSGIFQTRYSTDAGNNWDEYAGPITISKEGIADFRFFSIDKQGNEEEIKTEMIKIDKTAPEAKISFDKNSQKLEVEGEDNLSQNISISTTEKTIIESQKNKERYGFWLWGWLQKAKEQKIVQTIMLTDEAGHHTEIVLEKKKDKDGFIDLAVQSVFYDGQNKMMLNNNRLQYKWLLNWWGKKYPVFASHIKTQAMILESHYMQKKDQTWIMERPVELSDDDNDNFERRSVRKKMSGMVIPGIITNKGELQVIY